MIKKPLIFYPFLFAIFPLIFIFANNIEEVYFSEIIIPLVIMLGTTFLLFLLVKIIFKDAYKAGLVVFLFLVFFFSYGHFATLIQGISIKGFSIKRHMHMGSFYVFMLLLCMFILIRVLKQMSQVAKFRLTKILNTFTITLLALSIINAVSQSMRIKEQNLSKPNMAAGSITKYITSKQEGAIRPDIYYIILDGYAGASTLREVFGFDNSEFINFLEDEGFYVVKDALSNYPRTGLSLPSSLNMQYHPIDDRNTARAIDLLKSMGYKYFDVGGLVSTLKHKRSADAVFKQGHFNEFLYLFINTTMLRIISNRVNFLSSNVRNQILFSFDKLEDMPNIEGPKFVFVHIMAPHPPYVFGPNGEETKLMNVASSLNIFKTSWDDTQSYLNQLLFVNKKVQNAIEVILNKSKTAPIIIVQSDHGPSFRSSGDDKYRMLMHIINAYYFPDGRTDKLYEAITPVNSFRVVFNEFFGTDFELLEDKNYYSTQEKKFEFIDVTDKARINDE